jgi:hypothetical protein
VPVKATKTGEAVNLRFDWDRMVGAAVFRRGEAVWVVFDAPARLDMAGAADLGPAGAARWAAGSDYVAVRIEAPKDLAVGVVAEGNSWTVRLGGPPSAAGGVSVDRDPSGEPALVFSMAGSGRAIWLTDPLVGDRFAAVTAVGPVKGFGDRRRTMDLHVLPSAQGLAIETVADDLTITADGDRVVLSRPGGLILSSPSALLDAAEVADGAPRKAAFPAVGRITAPASPLPTPTAKPHAPRRRAPMYGSCTRPTAPWSTPLPNPVAPCQSMRPPLRSAAAPLT